MWRERALAWLGYAPEVDLRERADPATLPEKMDGPSSYGELRRCLRDLARVNGVTGGYRPTLAFLERVVARRSPNDGPIEILDIGFGYGDALRRVRRWSQERGVPVRLAGIELQPWAAELAAETDRSLRVPAGEIRWLTGDVLGYDGPRPDVVVSSLVMHHLPEPAIAAMVRWMEQNARRGWLINDLERSERPYRWFGVLARAMRWHPYIRHDGPVSFRRAFVAADWDRLLAQAGVRDGRIFSVAPARLCVEKIRF